MRITTSMVQRNVLADLNTLSEQARRDAEPGVLGQGDHPPERRPLRHGARAGAARRARRPTSSTSATSGRPGLAGRHRVLAATRSPSTSTARASSLLQGVDRLRRPDLARRGRQGDRPDHPGHQGGRRTPPTATATSSPAPRPRPRRTSSATTTPTRATGRPRPDVPGVREIGPGVTMPSTPSADELLGDGRATDRRQAARLAARHLRPPARPATAPSLRGDRHHQPRRRASTRCWGRAPRNGAMTNRLEAAADAPGPDRGARRPSSSRTPRTPTSPRR